MQKTVEKSVAELKSKKGPNIDSRIMEGIKLNKQLTDSGLTGPYKRKIFSSVQSLKF